MWLLNACFLLILPVPVSLKRFLALDFVFCFGMFPTLLLIISLYRPIQFLNEIKSIFFVVSTVKLCNLSLLFLRGDEHNHSLTFQFWHLLHFSKFLKISGQSQQQYFALVFKNYRAAFKKHISF